MGISVMFPAVTSYGEILRQPRLEEPSVQLIQVVLLELKFGNTNFGKYTHLRTIYDLMTSGI